jgi:hypothetical protein
LLVGQCPFVLPLKIFDFLASFLKKSRYCKSVHRSKMNHHIFKFSHLPVGHDAEVDVLGEGGLNGLREEERLQLVVRF